MSSNQLYVDMLFNYVNKYVYESFAENFPNIIFKNITNTTTTFTVTPAVAVTLTVLQRE